MIILIRIKDFKMKTLFPLLVEEEYVEREQNTGNENDNQTYGNEGYENESANIPRTNFRREKQPREKVMSQTILFAANLPFSLDDAGLAAIFEGPGLVSARVVRTRNLRSRGYGFVEFTTEQEQLKALEEKQGQEMVGHNGLTRTLALSISSSPVPQSEPDEVFNNQL